MAEPARRRSEAGSAADDPERKPDPRAGGWADVRRALITDSYAVSLAAAEVASRPGDPQAVAMLTLTLQVLESLAAMARRWQVDEAVIDAERERAWQAGDDACKAQRGRLTVVDGG